ncbi:MAG: hypothetical protein JJ959_11475 [Nisaea sp.]|uniref:hypothetical protein n=1 Tax=Nisaea sp. TaxID=2024842 RepID=UPI001B266074|nr:hypothetical protein [Nisaea sp.]MBO6561153.1 hypothetical protein [Nisaea sp.]
MKSIMVSTPVFAAIWSARAEGEETEDQILRRVLQLPDASPEAGVEAPAEPSIARDGFVATRYNVRFPEGFKIHRIYKGQRHEAVATGGAWKLLPSGQRFHSLVKLSKGIGTKTENVWRNWLFTDSDGNEKQISDLRDPSTIHTRHTY